MCLTIINSVYIVAPRTGAWIETVDFIDMKVFPIVAPRTGAWIETRKQGGKDFPA